MESNHKTSKIKNNYNLKDNQKSLNNLKIDQIDTLLFHDTKQIVVKWEKIFNNILKLKKKGLIKKRFSVYTLTKYEKILKVSIFKFYSVHIT